MADSQDSIFYELPQALVDEMLQSCGSVSVKLASSFNKVKSKKEEIRGNLKELGLLHRDSEISPSP